MSHVKHAEPDHPIHDLLARRWSPYAFSGRAVAREDLLALFEAARWAPSSYNAQPWRYVVAVREEGEAFERLLSCLVEGNQAWARHAPVLALGIAMRELGESGKPNPASRHDLGLAAGNLCVEATHRGLAVHQMIGILPERARELYGIPDDAEALTGLAIGYPGEGEALEDRIRDRDKAPRGRRPLREFVFGSRWGQPAPLLG